jgi:hypothetical protein
MLCKHAVAAEFNSSIHQFENYVLAFLADSRYMFHFDNEFTATKIYSGLFAGAPQLRYPGCEELSFNHQPTLRGAINQRDFQHCLFPLAIEARRTPNSLNRKSLNFQGEKGRDFELSRSKKLKASKLSKLQERDRFRGLRITHIASRKSQISSFEQGALSGLSLGE